LKQINEDKLKDNKENLQQLSKRNKILTKDHIDQWKQFYMDNDEYCERLSRISRGKKLNF
jgi:hypothetical protein